MIRVKKTFITLILSCLVLSCASAQKFKSFAGLRFGGALPMGELASHEYGKGGYALLGKSYGLEAAWFINPKIGFGIDLSSSSFGFASGYYAQDYKSSEPAFLQVEMLSGPYSLKTYMAGAYYKVALSKKFFSTFKLMGGVFEATTPTQFYGVNAYFVGYINFWKTGSLDRSFTFLTGASLEYKLYDQVSFVLQADFTYSEAGFVYKRGDSYYTDYMKMPVFKLQPGVNIHF